MRKTEKEIEQEKKIKEKAEVEQKVTLVEREINLPLLNEKLNYLIELGTKIANKIGVK